MIFQCVVELYIWLNLICISLSFFGRGRGDMHKEQLSELGSTWYSHLYFNSERHKSFKFRICIRLQPSYDFKLLLPSQFHCYILTVETIHVITLTIFYSIYIRKNIVRLDLVWFVPICIFQIYNFYNFFIYVTQDRYWHLKLHLINCDKTNVATKLE